jgi:hypothetical protein
MGPPGDFRSWIAIAAFAALMAGSSLLLIERRLPTP